MSGPYVLPFLDLAGICFSLERTFNPRSFPSGGSGMNGTAEDVARLLEIVRSGGGGLIRPNTAQAMLTNHTGRFAIINGPGWGFEPC